MALLTRRPRSQVDAPGLHLQSISDAPRTRSASGSRPRPVFLPREERSSPCNPLSDAFHGNRRRPPGFRFPSGLSGSHWIVALGPAPSGETCRRKWPDRPSLPVALTCIVTPDRRFGLATALRGLLSFKPLGTSIIMHRRAILVNPQVAFFLRKYFTCHHVFTNK